MFPFFPPFYSILLPSSHRIVPEEEPSGASSELRTECNAQQVLLLLFRNVLRWWSERRLLPSISFGSPSVRPPSAQRFSSTVSIIKRVRMCCFVAPHNAGMTWTKHPTEDETRFHLNNPRQVHRIQDDDEGKCRKALQSFRIQIVAHWDGGLSTVYSTGSGGRKLLRIYKSTIKFGNPLSFPKSSLKYVVTDALKMTIILFICHSNQPNPNGEAVAVYLFNFRENNKPKLLQVAVNS